jgi:hypothetical protein
MKACRSAILLLVVCLLPWAVVACSGGETTTETTNPDPVEQPADPVDVADADVVAADAAAEAVDPDGDSAPPADADADGDSAPPDEPADAVADAAAEEGAEEAATDATGEEGEEAAADGAPTGPDPARSLGGPGLEEGTDFGNRLNDPRFPDTLDSGPVAWPAWQPSHRIEFIEVPTVEGVVMKFQREGGKKLVYGEVYQDGSKFEIRFKLFENGKRIQFDRTQCTWDEGGSELVLGCKSPGNKTSKTYYKLTRTEAGWTIKQTERSVKDVPFAPRELSVTML